MKYVVLWLMLVLPLPAWAAGLDLTVYNQIETQQIQSLLLHTDGGRLYWTSYTLPGSFARYNNDTSGDMESLVLDMGLVRYTFDDFRALKGRGVTTLELHLEETGSEAVPVLTLREDASVRIEGQTEDMLPEDKKPEHVPAFAQVIAAKTMTEAAKLAGNEEYSSKGELFFNLNLGDVYWRATLVPELPFGTSNAWVVAQSVPTAVLNELNTITWHTPENVRGTLEALHALGYRPWSVSMRQGVDNELMRYVQMHKEGMTQEEAKAMTEEWLLTPGTSTDTLLQGEAVLVPEAYYAEAVSDAQTLSPNACVVLRVNNIESMDLRWIADCSMMLKFSR